MSLEVTDSSKFEKYVQYYLILDQEIENQQEQLKTTLKIYYLIKIFLILKYHQKFDLKR